MSRLVFSPLSIWLLLGLVLLVIVGLPLLFLGVIGAALAGLGFSFWVIVLLLVVIVVGSFVNVPLFTMRQRGSGMCESRRGSMLRRCMIGCTGRIAGMRRRSAGWLFR